MYKINTTFLEESLKSDLIFLIHPVKHSGFLQSRSHSITKKKIDCPRNFHLKVCEDINIRGIKKWHVLILLKQAFVEQAYIRANI